MGAMGVAGEKGDRGDRGEMGAIGDAGPQGSPGTPGTAGQSVVSAFEDAGVNCTYGGARFDSASGTSYACNGAPGGAGSAGASVTVFPEAAGTNCATGGTRLVSASGTSFVCNGATGTLGLARTVVVPHNGDDVAAGLALVYATSASPLQVLLDPGVYDIGTLQVFATLATIRGAGKTATTIRGRTSAYVLVNVQELHDLTVDRSAAAGPVVAAAVLKGVNVTAASTSQPSDFVALTNGGTISDVSVGTGTNVATTSQVTGVNCRGTATIRGLKVALASDTASIALGVLFNGGQLNDTHVAVSSTANVSLGGVSLQGECAGCSGISIDLTSQTDTTPVMQGFMGTSSGTGTVSGLRVRLVNLTAPVTGSIFRGLDLSTASSPGLRFTDTHVSLSTVPGAGSQVGVSWATGASPPSGIIRNSSIVGFSVGLNVASSNPLRITQSVLDGTRLGSNFACAQVIDSSGAAVTCP
ncbi:MAG: collagen-like protein [Archangiaceae bacterium]|nr:collagen-like protein [Archangiaceae bacterium]